MMFTRVLYVLACLAVPVIWGIVVNWAFDALRNRDNSSETDEPVFPDYQI